MFHVTEEKRQQEGANVRAIDVRVAHEDDFAVADFRRVKIVADAGADRRKNIADFFVLQNFMKTGLLDVQNFSFERKDRLESPIAPLLRAAARRISFHKIEFAMLGVVDGTVGKFSGKAATVECVLPACEVACFSCGFARLGGTETLLDNSFRIAGILVQPVGKFLPDDRFNDAFHFAVAELRFRLSFKLRLWYFHADHSRESFPEVVSGKSDLVLFHKIVLIPVIVERAGQRSAKSNKMCSPFVRVDVVDVRKNIFGILLVVLQRYFNLNYASVLIFALPFCIDRFLHHGRARCVDVLHKFDNAAFKVETFGLFLFRAKVGDLK